MTRLPADCERPLLERFLRAEAMALWAVRAARAVRPAGPSPRAAVPPHALEFLRRHEEEEARHLKEFEALTGVRARQKEAPPRVPGQWHALAVQLYGYEALGLEFARLLVSVRPDLAHIEADEEIHVGFFEREVRAILEAGGGSARGAREFARAFLRRLPKTVGRYLQGPELAPHREELTRRILEAIESRFGATGLLDGTVTPTRT
jgi:hypothetical protein